MSTVSVRKGSLDVGKGSVIDFTVCRIEFCYKVLLES